MKPALAASRAVAVLNYMLLHSQADFTQKQLADAIGVNQTSMSSVPPLSTIALPHYELGVEGVRMLLALKEGDLQPPLRRYVSCPPVLRRST